MFRAFFRLMLVIVVIAAAGVLYWNYSRDPRGTDPAGRTSGRIGGIDTEKARQTGAKIAEGAADVTKKAAEVLDDASLTGKIKAKMALDDNVKARAINVDTRDGVVTLTGTVGSNDERQRAVTLAKETLGVKSVVNRLRVVR